MPRKTLENLTFAIIRTAMAVEDAEELVDLMPFYKNRIALCTATEAFETARIELSAALGSTSITHYMQGIQEATSKAAKRISKSLDSRKGHRLFIKIEE